MRERLDNLEGYLEAQRRLEVAVINLGISAGPTRYHYIHNNGISRSERHARKNRVTEIENRIINVIFPYLGGMITACSLHRGLMRTESELITTLCNQPELIILEKSVGKN